VLLGHDNISVIGARYNICVIGGDWGCSPDSPFLYPPLVETFVYLEVYIRHLRWHKEGVRDNLNVVAHPADIDAWKA
jgi:hypothetical protein